MHQVLNPEPPIFIRFTLPSAVSGIQGWHKLNVYRKLSETLNKLRLSQMAVIDLYYYYSYYYSYSYSYYYYYYYYYYYKKLFRNDLVVSSHYLG